MVLFAALGQLLRAQDLVEFFTPVEVGPCALSPEGDFIAVTRTLAEGLVIDTVDTAKRSFVGRVRVDDLERYEKKKLEIVAGSSSLNWLSWHRGKLVLLISRNLTGRPEPQQRLLTVSPQGTEAAVVLKADYAREYILTIEPLSGREDEVVITTALQRDGSLRRRFNLATGTFVGKLPRGESVPGKPVAKPAGVAISSLFPGRFAELLAESADQRLSVVQVQDIIWPGFIALYDAQTKKADRYFDVAPTLGYTKKIQVVPLAELEPSRLGTTGLVVVPPVSGHARAPLIVLVRSGRDDQPFNRYDARVRAMVESGFAVAVVTQPYAWKRSVVADQRASEPSDVLAARLTELVDTLARRLPVSRRSVAFWGEGDSAQALMNSAVVKPGMARLVVAIEPWASELLGDRDMLNEIPGQAAALRAASEPPVHNLFLAMGPRRRGQGLEGATNAYWEKTLVPTLLKQGADVLTSELTPGYFSRNPVSRDRVYRQAFEYLRRNLLPYSVHIGEAEVIPET